MPNNETDYSTWVRCTGPLNIGDEVYLPERGELGTVIEEGSATRVILRTPSTSCWNIQVRADDVCWGENNSSGHALVHPSKLGKPLPLKFNISKSIKETVERKELVESAKVLKEARQLQKQALSRPILNALEEQENSAKYFIEENRPKVISVLSPLKPVFYKDENDNYVPLKFGTSDPSLPVEVLKRQLHSLIKQKRQELREKDTEISSAVTKAQGTSRYSGMRQLQTIFGVHEEPGKWLQVYFEERAQICFTDKKPTNGSFHIGVEIECFTKSDHKALAAKFVQAGVGEYVSLAKDGSIKGYPAGFTPVEVRVIVTSDNYKTILAKVSDILFKDGAKVNETCGLHVHLDIRNKNPEERALIHNNLVVYHRALEKMLPITRTGENAYNKRNISTIQDPRSRGWHINAAAASRHGTFEVRSHSPTVNSAKIVNWIDILGKIYNQTTKAERTPSHIDHLCRRLAIGAELKAYIRQRVEKHNPGDSFIADRIPNEQV